MKLDGSDTRTGSAAPATAVAGTTTSGQAPAAPEAGDGGDAPSVVLGAARLADGRGPATGAGSPAGAVEPLVLAPRPRRLGCLRWLLALLVLAGLACAGIWFTSDDARRGELVDKVLSRVKDTPVERLVLEAADRLLPKPPVPPINESRDNGAMFTDPNTLSGRSVKADIGSAAGEFTQPKPGPQPQAQPQAQSQPQTQPQPGVPAGAGEPAPATTAAAPAPADPMAPIPPVQEDERVTPAFVRDLASWVVRQYQPGSRGGSLAVSVQSLNRRYGASLTGLRTSSRDGGGRASILRYAFSPSMIRALYGIYADPFLDAVAASATRPGGSLNAGQLKSLYTVLAGRCRLLASGLESVCAIPDLPQRVRALDEGEKAVSETVAAMNEARIAYNQAVELRTSADAVARAQTELDNAAARFRAASDNERALQVRLAEDIRSRGARRFDDETALYLARWVGRRHQNDSRAMESVQVAAAMLRDLAGRCDKAALEGPPSSRPAPAPAPAPAVAPLVPVQPASAPEAAPAGQSPASKTPAAAPATPETAPAVESAPAAPAKEEPAAAPASPSGEEKAPAAPSTAAPEAAPAAGTLPATEAPATPATPEAAPSAPEDASTPSTAPAAPGEHGTEPQAPEAPALPEPAPDVRAQPVAQH